MINNFVTVIYVDTIQRNIKQSGVPKDVLTKV